jgi:hypothetical protein
VVHFRCGATPPFISLLFFLGALSLMNSILLVRNVSFNMSLKSMFLDRVFAVALFFSFRDGNLVISFSVEKKWSVFTRRHLFIIIISNFYLFSNYPFCSQYFTTPTNPFFAR